MRKRYHKLQVSKSFSLLSFNEVLLKTLKYVDIMKYIRWGGGRGRRHTRMSMSAVLCM